MTDFSQIGFSLKSKLTLERAFCVFFSSQSMSIWPTKDPSFQDIFNGNKTFYKIMKNNEKQPGAEN